MFIVYHSIRRLARQIFASMVFFWLRRASAMRILTYSPDWDENHLQMRFPDYKIDRRATEKYICSAPIHIFFKNCLYPAVLLDVLLSSVGWVPSEEAASSPVAEPSPASSGMASVPCALCVPGISATAAPWRTYALTAACSCASSVWASSSRASKSICSSVKVADISAAIPTPLNTVPPGVK